MVLITHYSAIEAFNSEDPISAIFFEETIIANNLKLSICKECRYDLVYYFLKWTGEKIDISRSIDKYIGMLL